MAYTKTIWKDHLTEHQYRYKNLKTNEVLDLEPQEGEIFQEGTPINSEKLNHIEDGIEEAHKQIAEIPVYQKSSTAEAEEGTNTEKIMTPKTTKDAILKLAPQLEYKDIRNLSATPAGVITWSLPQSTDNTRTAIVLCRATKDISNMDYAACLADGSITETALIQNATSTVYSELSNATRYWVKVFVKYAIGGKEFCSGGVTVTFIYIKPVVVTEFYNAGNEFAAVTGGWLPYIVEATPTTPSAFARKTASYLEITAKSPGIQFGEEGCAAFITKNKINLSGISLIKFDVEITVNPKSGGLARIGTTLQVDSKTSETPGVTIASDFPRRIFSFLCNGVSEAKHLYFNLLAVNRQGIGHVHVKVYRVWGES